MKKILLFIIIVQFSLVQYSQIIADHTVVDKFDDIPQYYIDQIKKMWLTVPGESHSQAYRAGLALLETSFPAYAVNIVESGTPESYTTSNLRVSRATWGDYSNSSGWIYSYGEEDWFTSATAISRTKAGITYCSTHSLNIGAIGFGWCYDPAIDYANIGPYLSATQEYVDYCATKGYSTKVFYTTGPIDGLSYMNGGVGRLYSYNIHLRYEATREYVALDESRILFDYADILSYDDDGSRSTLTYNGVDYEVITPTNLGSANIGHIGSAGAIRLAKAMWWMLARIAGWDGGATTGMNALFKEPSARELFKVAENELLMQTDDNWISARIGLYNISGNLMVVGKAEGNLFKINISHLSPGMYFVVLEKQNVVKIQKIIIS